MVDSDMSTSKQKSRAGEKIDIDTGARESHADGTNGSRKRRLKTLELDLCGE